MPCLHPLALFALAPRRQGHPLHRCLMIVERLLQHDDAHPFSEPASARSPSLALLLGNSLAWRQQPCSCQLAMPLPQPLLALP